MKTLAHFNDAAEIRNRLLALTSDDKPQWGIMSVTQMVCHLREAYLIALSPEEVRHITLQVSPKIAKYLALGPIARWPKNLPTLNELKIGGTSMATSTFAADHSALLEAFDQFCASASLAKDHPYFITMSHGDWTRWGYRHAGHHLRQFGR